MKIILMNTFNLYPLIDVLNKKVDIYTVYDPSQSLDQFFQITYTLKWTKTYYRQYAVEM